MNIISEVLSACVSSARSEPMKLRRPDGTYFTIPSQLNVMLLMPSGAGKSTYIDELPEKNFVEIIDYSLPALIGSIDDKGDIVPGFVMKAAGKALVIDEFHNLKAAPKRALLSLTEQQKAIRILGRNAKRPLKKNGKYLKYQISDNEIAIKYVRMSMLLSGIYSPHKSLDPSVDDFALCSRFLPVSLDLTFDDIDNMDLGKKYFEIKADIFRESPVFEDWPKFIRCYKEVVKNMPPKITLFFTQNTQFYRRIRLLFARFFAYAFRDNSVVDDWERYIPYIPFFLYNCIKATLTHSEFEVYTMLKGGMKQKEIASMLKCSEGYVSQVSGKIRGMELT